MGKKKKNGGGCTCDRCGGKKICRPWFTDRKGIRHYAASYGRKVFSWCPDCD